MASYVTPKKNTQFIFYVGLVSQASAHSFQSNPTIAAGDFKVSTDGGALANLGTLPTVTPASSKMVKITLSTSEMNGDNVTVVCSDAAGAEWDDLIINIQTSARQVDDLAYPATSGRSMVVDASGLVDANVVKVGPTGSGTAQTARDMGASVLLSAGTGTGQLDFTSGVVKANLAQILGTALTETAGQIAAGFKKLFDVAAPVFDLLSAKQTGDSFARLGAPVGASHSADVANVQADTDNIQTRLPAALVSGRMDSSVGAMAADVVTASAIAADAIGSSELAASAVSEIQSGLSTLDAAGVRGAAGLAAANLDTQLAAIAAYIDTEVAAILAAVDTEVAAIKAKTDQMTFTVANKVDATATIGGNATVGGYAAGQDPATLVLDALAASHNTANTIGAKIGAGAAPTVSQIDAQLSSTHGAGLWDLSGGGAILTTFTVTDGTDPLDGVLVEISTDLLKANVIASGYTLSNGTVKLNLDPGTYYKWAQLAGYDFTNPTAITVS